MEKRTSIPPPPSGVLFWILAVPRAQRIGVIDAAATHQGEPNPDHHPVASGGPVRGADELKTMVNEFPQVQMPDEDSRQEQADIDHQEVIVEGDSGQVAVVAWQHPCGAPSPGSSFCCKISFPRTPSCTTPLFVGFGFGFLHSAAAVSPRLDWLLTNHRTSRSCVKSFSPLGRERGLIMRTLDDPEDGGKSSS